MVLALVTARCPNLAGSGTPGAVVYQLVGEAKVQGTPGLVPARWWAECCPWLSGSGAPGVLALVPACWYAGGQGQVLGGAVGSEFLPAAGMLVGGALPCPTSCLA